MSATNTATFSIEPIKLRELRFWNVDAVARDLRSNQIPRTHPTGYALCILLLCLIQSVFSVVFYDASEQIITYSYWDYVWELIANALLVSIFVWCYRTNQHGDGERFIERIVCLSVPILVRCCVFVMMPFLIFSDLLPDSGAVADSIWIVETIGLILAIGWYLQKTIARVSAKDEPLQPAVSQ